MAGEPHVLLVDDERDIRDPLASYLSKNGLRVTKARECRRGARSCSPPMRSTSSCSTS